MFFLLTSPAVSVWAATDFPVPPGAPDRPVGIVTGPDGNIWFANSNSGTIGRITLAGVITRFPVPNSVAIRGITLGADGNLWFIDGPADMVGRITPTGNVATFALGTGRSPTGITRGPDGAIWFTQQNPPAIGRITGTGVITEFRITPQFPVSVSTPFRITTGPDGNLWFTQASAVGRITPQGVITLFPVSGSNLAIAPGPDGNIWFTQTILSSAKIGRITPSGVVTLFPPPPGIIDLASGSIVAGPDGNLWFRRQRVGPVLARITPSGVITGFNLPNFSLAGEIAVGPDGHLWLTDPSLDQIGRTDLSGILTNTFALNHGAGVRFITTGPDGNLWFTASNSRNVGRITPAGTLTQFPVPGGCIPLQITSGPDNALWFTDFCGQVNRLTTEGSISSFPILRSGSSPAGITTGADGNLWVADLSGAIERFTPTNPPVQTEFPIPFSQPFSIAPGPDGNLWFVDVGNNAIGRITTAGTVAQFPAFFSLIFADITQGPDGKLWFPQAGTVGNITTDGTMTNFAQVLSGASQGITAGPDGHLWVTDAPGLVFAINASGVFSLPVRLPLQSFPRGIAVGPDHKLWFADFNRGVISRMSAIHGEALPISASAGLLFSGAVATYFSGTPTAVQGDFTATVDWGDGSTSIGAVTGPLGGPFQVSANHTYAQSEPATIKVTLHDAVDNTDYQVEKVVSVIQRTPSQTTLQSSANPAPAGQSVIFIAIVSGSGSVSGAVQFEDFGVVIGTGTVDGAGVATFSTSTLSVGPHIITATYMGDSTNLPSTSPALDQIVHAPEQTLTTLILSPSAPAVRGRLASATIALTVTLDPLPNTGTGTVQFFAGTRLLGSAAMNDGEATLSTNQLKIGANILKAVYSGDSNFAGSISPVVVLYRSPRPR